MLRGLHTVSYLTKAYGGETVAQVSLTRTQQSQLSNRDGPRVGAKSLNSSACRDKRLTIPAKDKDENSPARNSEPSSKDFYI